MPTRCRRLRVAELSQFVGYAAGWARTYWQGSTLLLFHNPDTRVYDEVRFVLPDSEVPARTGHVHHREQHSHNSGEFDLDVSSAS